MDYRSLRGSEVRRKVLVVAMLDSIHTARWLSQFVDEEIDFYLFPSSPMRRVHAQIAKLAKGPLGDHAVFRIFPLAKYWALPLWIIDKAVNNAIRGRLLALWFRKISPNYVHGLEMQNAGYLILRSFERVARVQNSKILVTNWGSDIFWFQRDPRHRQKLKRLLRLAHAYACECQRDVALALSLGFKGEIMPVLPNAGGFDAEYLNDEILPPEERRLIAVKGYHGWVGRAHIALQALEAISAELQDYEVVVYSCNLSTRRLATQMAKRTGLKVTAYSKGALSHDEMVEKFSKSLIYVGLSLSDGISTSMLEAMARGAIPVQTSTACCDEWFSDTGVAIQNLTAEEVAHGIQRAIGLALTSDSAAKNRDTVRARASREEIARQAISFYRL